MNFLLPSYIRPIFRLLKHTVLAAPGAAAEFDEGDVVAAGGGFAAPRGGSAAGRGAPAGRTALLPPALVLNEAFVADERKRAGDFSVEEGEIEELERLAPLADVCRVYVGHCVKRGFQKKFLTRFIVNCVEDPEVLEQRWLRCRILP
jgi:hypothetical protein